MTARVGVAPGSACCPSTSGSLMHNGEEGRTEAVPRASDETIKRCCSEKGSRNLFSVDPPVVNFGAFAPSEVRSRSLRITNTSSLPVRFCILPPEDSAFRLSFEKKSYLAPGMAQAVTVHFAPLSWKLCKGCIRLIGVPLRTPDLHATSKALVAESYTLQHIQLSAFPAVRNIRLPRFLDFGSVALGHTKRKTLELSNPYQVPFQFSARVVKSNSAFSVEPLSGEVSAGSATVLTISYTPQVRATAFFAIEVHIAEYKSRPLLVEAWGSCGTARSRHAGQSDVARGASRKGVVHRAAAIGYPLTQRAAPDTSAGGSDEAGRLHFRSKPPRTPTPTANGGSAETGPVFKVNRDMEHGRAVQGPAKSFRQRSSSSERAKEPHGVLEQTSGRAGTTSGAYFADDLVRVSQFNRRWDTIRVPVCLKTYKSTLLGEPFTTELKRQRLLSKRRYEALELLRKNSERDLGIDCSGQSPEIVVVPSTWVPRRVHGGTQVLGSNLFTLRMESIEKFARVVSSLIKKMRALRRLHTLQRALKIRQATAAADSNAGNTTPVSFMGSESDAAESNKNRLTKQVKISAIPCQRTLYQELFQAASSVSSVPPAFLVRSKIEVADLFKSLDNYEQMSSLPPLDYEIMRLPDVEASNPAWHLEPTDRRLLQALLRHVESISGHRNPKLSPRCRDIEFPSIVFDRPHVSAAHFVAPPATEFRPIIPLPKTVETDLGYCFNKVQPENDFKHGPRLSLPSVGDTTVSGTRKNSSAQRCEDLLLREIQGNHLVCGQPPILSSTIYLRSGAGRVEQEDRCTSKMSDTDSDGPDGSVDVPVPPFDSYAQSDSGDEQPPCGTTDTITRGELHDSKYEDFVQATAALSDAWGRRSTDMANRLDEINMILPAELRMDSS